MQDADGGAGGISRLCFSILIGSGGDASTCSARWTARRAGFSILIGSGGDASEDVKFAEYTPDPVSVSSSDRVVMQAVHATRPARYDFVSVSSSDRVVMQASPVDIPKLEPKMFQYPHRIGW